MLTSLYLLIQQAPPNLTGTYEVRMKEPGDKVAKAQDRKTTPPGQIRWFVIQGNRWMMRDMMVGFDGTFKVKGRIVTFTTLNTPSGKSKTKDQLVFDLSKDGKQLTVRKSKMMEAGALVLVRTSTKPAFPIPK